MTVEPLVKTFVRQVEINEQSGEGTITAYFKPADGKWRKSIQKVKVLGGRYIAVGPPKIELVSS